MHSGIFGFAVGEFEATVFSQRDELTAQEVVDLYSEIVGSIDSSSEFCYIDHLFTQPGYFISYGVSALASFSVFDDVMNDPSAAAENYDKLAAVSCKNGEYSFRSALEHCGIDDVLTKEYVEELASQLMSYAETL